MPNVVSALTARTQFGQIIKRATQKNERFVVGRRGEPSVVIMRSWKTTRVVNARELLGMIGSSFPKIGRHGVADSAGHRVPDPRPWQGVFVRCHRAPRYRQPAGKPARHLEIRAEQGVRPGGFGILLTRNLVDELIYSEKGNEVLFI